MNEPYDPDKRRWSHHGKDGYSAYIEKRYTRCGRTDVVAFEQFCADLETMIEDKKVYEEIKPVARDFLKSSLAEDIRYAVSEVEEKNAVLRKEQEERERIARETREEREKREAIAYFVFHSKYLELMKEAEKDLENECSRLDVCKRLMMTALTANPVYHLLSKGKQLHKEKEKTKVIIHEAFDDYQKDVNPLTDAKELANLVIGYI